MKFVEQLNFKNLKLFVEALQTKPLDQVIFICKKQLGFLKQIDNEQNVTVFRGFINYFKNGVIRGWILAQSNEIPRIELFIKNKLISKEQISIKYQKKGKRFVFTIPIRSFEEKLSVFDFQVKYNGRLLPKRPDLFATHFALFGELTKKPPLFFIHVPKTAGTSIRHMLSQIISEEKIYPHWKEVSLQGGYLPAYRLSEISSDRMLGLQLIMGHYPFRIASLFSRARKVIFLRSPVERCISNLIHLHTKKEIYKKMSLEELFETVHTQMDNLQVRYLATIPCPRKLTNKHLGNAISNLETCYFVGITEYFDLSIQLFEQQFDQKFSRKVRMNTMERKKDFSISSTLMDKIVDCNQLDIILYNAAVKLFKARVSKI